MWVCDTVCVLYTCVRGNVGVCNKGVKLECVVYVGVVCTASTSYICCTQALVICTWYAWSEYEVGMVLLCLMWVCWAWMYVTVDMSIMCVSCKYTLSVVYKCIRRYIGCVFCLWHNVFQCTWCVFQCMCVYYVWCVLCACNEWCVMCVSVCILCILYIMHVECFAECVICVCQCTWCAHYV